MKPIESKVDADEPMEIDDIIESVCLVIKLFHLIKNSKFYFKKVNKLRKDGLASKTNKIQNTALTHLIDENTQSQIKTQLSIIIDTNIFLSHLKSIKEFTNQTQKPIVFIVPWIVVQELDKCKHKSQNDNINKKAQEAIKFITSVLQSKCASKFVFENALQSNQESNLIKCFSPDDYILKCGLQLKQSNPESNIYLLTNDKNLLNKSLINHLNSINFDDFVKNFTKNEINLKIYQF